MPLIRNAFRRLHYPVDIIAQCVRWYLAYALSLRNLEEMMTERGIVVDHSTLHRWVIRLVPLLDEVFRRHKRTVGRRWRMDETYIRIKGQWKYLYRAVDRGSTPEPPKFPLPQFQPSNQCIQVNNFIAALEGIMSVQQDMLPGHRRYPGQSLNALVVSFCFQPFQ
ncbi:TPA: IS6 family transposase [Klebsiella pneumoniae]|nr:IS6 family transposase [Klebsiella pneumoniae]